MHNFIITALKIHFIQQYNYDKFSVIFRSVEFMVVNNLVILKQVFKRVLVSGTERDSIIAFYNKVFMQSLKAYILQYSSSKVSRCIVICFLASLVGFACS